MIYFYIYLTGFILSYTMFLAVEKRKFLSYDIDWDDIPVAGFKAMLWPLSVPLFWVAVAVNKFVKVK